MSQSDVPIDTLPIWSRFNGVVFDGAAIAQIEGKGYGLVAQRDLQTDGETTTALLSVPNELLLNSESVEQYSRADKRFKELFDIAGHQSTRQDVILFLLAQIILVWASDEGGGVSNPWTQYIKFLPRTVPLPTLWSEDERQLLRGTSLEAAVQSKLRALEREFDDLREKAAEIPSWNELLCEKQVVTVTDYARLDAWYRSRCMELPIIGSTMVPCIDMINHAAVPNASYVRSSDGGVSLCLRPGVALETGKEISISYGETKPLAEMLFSYGFVDSESASDDKMLLPIEPPEDDPLVMAKARLYGETPTLRISRLQDGSVGWDCPFAHLLSLNEEDGLGIRLLQLNDGGREIRLFWEEQDVTTSIKSMQEITQKHPHHKVFQLRAMVIVQETVQAQLERLTAGTGDYGTTTGVRATCKSAALRLRESEARLLQDAVDILETEKTHLLENETILAYLGRTEVAQKDLVDGNLANEETDFS